MSRPMPRQRAATLGLFVPAALALGMSADTSYRFLKSNLGITDHYERLTLCGVAEAAIIALTVYAWATGTRGSAYLAYVIVLVQGIPAVSISGMTGGPVRVALGPVLLGLLLHLLLGLELRMSGRKSSGVLAAAGRELRERLVAFLGIGRRGEDSAAIARSRAADRAVDLADQLEAAQGKRREARLRARLAAQIDAARHGLGQAEAEAAEAAIVERVVRRKSVKGLATLDVRHDWAASLSPAPSVPVSRVPVLQFGGGVPPVSPTVPVPAPVPSGTAGQSVSPAPAPVSPPKAAVPAAVSPARSGAVHVSLKKRDTTGQPAVTVPAEHMDSLSAVVRFLTEMQHDRKEIRAIVPTLQGYEGTGAEALKKAIQRHGPKK